MTLQERLLELIRACFTGLWIETHEPDDALVEIAELCRQQDWLLARWDVCRGLCVGGQSAEDDSGGGAGDPLAAIHSLRALARPGSSAVLVLRSFHRFLQSAEIVEALAQQLTQGKQDRTFVVVLAPKVDIPLELEKQFIVVEHELPDRQQLEELARAVATEAGELPEGAEFEKVLDAAVGLTRHEAESAFSLSLVRDARITPAALWELKVATLKKSGLLHLYQGAETFDDLGGLDAMKAFCRRALHSGVRRPDVRPRGLTLLGVPGTGKSAFAQALGNECGRPTLTLDVGSLMGSLVGETERNIRQALKIADAMAPCVLFLDEVEKGLSGAASSGQTDSGVSARLFGTFLTWLNDHRSDVFVIATCNDISKLPPEFARAERFDAVFFLDLPGAEQKEAIWNIYLDKYALTATQARPVDTDYTGAEIKAVCRLSALLDVPLKEAARNVVPVAHTAAESVERLRTWASGRCLCAEVPDVYCRRQTAKPTRRKVNIGPSVN